MGDVADMVLNGALCESCGEYVGEPTGYPRECKGCREIEGKIVYDDDDNERGDINNE